jgi:hypothetical protein
VRRPHRNRCRTAGAAHGRIESDPRARPRRTDRVRCVDAPGFPVNAWESFGTRMVAAPLFGTADIPASGARSSGDRVIVAGASPVLD